MTAHFESVRRASFCDLVFPWDEIAIACTMRHHMHEYPHTPGAALEKLGRSAYTIRMTAQFDEGITKYTGENGLPLYPHVLERLQRLFEEEASGPLTIPAMGRIQASMVSFARKLSASSLSGEGVEFEFVEDQSRRFLFENLHAYKAKTTLEASALTRIPDAWKELEKKIPPDDFEKLWNAVSEPYEKLASAVNKALLEVDKKTLFAASKLQAVAQICQQIESRVDAFQDPMSWEVLEALKDLWASAVSLQASITQQNALNVYSTPRLMTIQEASQAIFGTTERSFELLQLNTVPDAFAIPAATSLHYIE